MCRFQEDPAWQCFRVVLSGPETPGEGEHKIMDYIRKAKVWRNSRLDFAAALIFWFCHVVLARVKIGGVKKRIDAR